MRSNSIDPQPIFFFCDVDQCATQLPAVGPDVVNKLVEILTLFNSRTCQLLLGAGATHLGMKTVSSSFQY
jgi:hypothetical protein